MSRPLDEPAIRLMVERFYARVRADPMLGPIFEARIRDRWPAHLDKMVDFWSSALLHVYRYAGNPRSAHASIPDLGPAHFERWLALFEVTLAELFDPETAVPIHARAQAMARALLRGRANQRPGLTPTETDEDHHHV